MAWCYGAFARIYVINDPLYIKHIVIRLLGVEKEIIPMIIEIETLIIRDSRSILI